MADAYHVGVGSPLATAPNDRTLTNLTLDATNDAVGGVFMASDAVTITQVGFRYGTRTGIPPTYRISLQSVSLTTGVQSGTILGGGTPASATFTPPADTTWDGTWQWVTLTNAYTTTRGEIFAIYIDYSSGTVDASNSSSFSREMNVFNSNMPYALQTVAGSSSKRAFLPIFAYRTASVTFGIPIENISVSPTYHSGSTNNEFALAFVLPAGWGATFKVLGLRLLTFRRWASGSSASLTLYDGTTALQGPISIDGDQTGGATTGFGEFYFDDATLDTLTYGTTYRLGLAAGSATSDMNFTSIGMDSAQDAAAFAGGPQFWLSYRSGAGAWTDDLTARPLAEPIFDDFTEPSGGGVTVVQASHGLIIPPFRAAGY